MNAFGNVEPMRPRRHELSRAELRSERKRRREPQTRRVQMFTQRHYSAIAEVIDTTAQHEAVDPTYREGWHAALSAVTTRLADLFAADSDRFNRELFERACAITKTERDGCATCSTEDTGRFAQQLDASGTRCDDCFLEVASESVPRTARERELRKLLQENIAHASDPELHARRAALGALIEAHRRDGQTQAMAACKTELSMIDRQLAARKGN